MPCACGEGGYLVVRPADPTKLAGLSEVKYRLIQQELQERLDKFLEVLG